jgi:HAD superfamily hydrolase (TIGR01549 family)
MKRLERIRAVIFDCDGVLFDSKRANIEFYNSIRAHFGLPPMDKEEEDYVHIHTAHESVNYIFRNTPQLREKAQQYRLNMDYTPFIKYMKMEPGLIQVLEKLKGSGFKLAIATNRSNTIGPVLEYFKLKHFFDVVISSLDVKHTKPHPESLYKILSHFGISNKEAVYVGDSSVDYEMAKAAEVPFIAYKNRNLNSDYHVDNLLDILRLLPPSN